MFHTLTRTYLRTIAALLLVCTALHAHASDAPQVLLKTSAGDIVVELNGVKAPKSTANFLQYVNKGFYNGTIFHRVMSSFMIQGGGFTADMQEKDTDAPITNEAKNGLSNAPYTIAMARRYPPHSATAQFFINVGNNTRLDYPAHDGWGYAVFGKVISGTDVVDKIKAVRVGRSGPHENVPLEPVTIISATVIKS
jgi:peptidyl-prolyl cis-trans isomerase A (cyclophilin A)